MNQDRRVIKTRRNIEDAFLQLLRTRPFDQITIYDITEEALISKGTFYHHYQDKYDLARSVVDEFLQQFRALTDNRFDNTDGRKTSIDLINRMQQQYEVLLSRYQVLSHLHIEEIDVEEEMKQILKEQYIDYLKVKQIRVENADFQGVMFASIAIDYLEYIEEHGITDIDTLVKDIKELSKVLENSPYYEIIMRT